jgi:hypothetical protein
MAFADPADPNPGSGQRKVLAGWISVSVAALNFSQLSLCALREGEGWWTERRCMRMGLSIGSLGLALGLPLLVLGYRQRAEQRAWMRRHGLDHLLSGVQVGSTRGGALVGYAAPF